MVTPAWRIEQRKRRNEEENSAERDGARPDEVERLAVSHRLGDRVYDDRQISADVVHQEEEDGDRGGSNLGRNYFHHHREQDREPGLGWKTL